MKQITSRILPILIVFLIPLSLGVPSNLLSGVLNTAKCLAPKWPPMTLPQLCLPDAAFITRLANVPGNKTNVLTMEQLINQEGLGIQVVKVVVDGRTAVLYRLTQNGAANSGKGVLLLHGLLGNACTYVAITGCASIAYSLFESGMDVWMMDNPGTINSTGSTQPPIESPYWDFGWDTVGDTYLPVVFNQILTARGDANGKIDVIGHSMGTTTLMVALTTNPALNLNIERVILIAPVFHFAHYSPLINLAAIAENLLRIPSAVDPNNLAVPVPGAILMQALRKYGGGYCNYNGLADDICLSITTTIMGCTNSQTDPQRLGALIRCAPDVATLRMLRHYAQCILAGQFQKFDYGPIKNKQLYENCSPPAYDLSQVNVSIYTISGTADVLSPPEDNTAINAALGANFKGTLILKDFNHIDYMDGYEKTVCSCVINYIKSVFQIGDYDKASCSAALN